MALIDDLSSELLAEIVERLLAMVSELAYALELRLICNKFNEVILHKLFASGEYTFEIERYESLSIDYPFSRRETTPDYFCLWAGPKTVNISWVKTCYVSGRILNHRLLNTRRAALYQQLQAAVQRLEILTKQNSRIGQDIHQALLTPGSTTLNSAIEDLAMYTICQAFTLFFTNDSIFDERKDLRPEWIEDMGATYWLVIVACWSGSIALLDHLEVHEQATNISSPIIEMALQGIPIAIRRDHADIVEHILSRNPKVLLEENAYFTSTIEAALRIGSPSMTTRMLQVATTRSTTLRILCALRRARPDPGRYGGYITVLHQLIPLVTSIEPSKKSILTNKIAQEGKSAGVKLLQEWNVFSAHILPRAAGRNSALELLSSTGDLETLKELFRTGYLDVCKPHIVETVIERAAIMALSRNHIEIFDELNKHSPKLDDHRWIPFLAVADGTFQRLQILCESAKWLNEPFCPITLVRTAQLSIGQVALEMAMMTLKPRTVELLLRRGIRLVHESRSVHTNWSYARYHGAALLETQLILSRHKLPTIEVIV